MLSLRQYGEARGISDLRWTPIAPIQWCTYEFEDFSQCPREVEAGTKRCKEHAEPVVRTQPTAFNKYFASPNLHTNIWVRDGEKNEILLMKDALAILNKTAAPVAVEPRRTHNLFHKLWTKAVGTEGYVKEEWIELEKVIVRADSQRTEGAGKDA